MSVLEFNCFNKIILFIQKTYGNSPVLDNHPYYVAVQFHPEYLSRPLKPSPPFLGLILASVKKLEKFLDHGCRLSPRDMSDISSGKNDYA